MRGDSSGDSSGDEEHVETEKAASFKNLPASVRKMKAESSDSSKESNEDELEDVNGFRLIDIAILAAVFESLLFPACKQGHVVFDEDKESKMGLASLLILKCTTRKCSFYKSVCTSYYGKAIRQNTHDIDCMQNAVMAIWHHSKS